MVLLTRILQKFVPKTRKSDRVGGTRFIDKLRITVSGGPGGQGFQKFGGYGGKGGDVYVVGKEGATLKALHQRHPVKRFKAGVGQDSRRHVLAGAEGRGVEVPVQSGVRVLSAEGRLLGEINSPEDKVLVAKGGPGGTPQTGFLGRRGESRVVTLDLKLIADVGLVGFPNAGKSTLLKAISRASPKIASYAFTTIRPQLGTLQYDDLRQITIADLPGLIEGAHMNKGLGHTFLKHVERTRLLLFLVDIGGFQLGVDYPMRSPLETVLLLNKELELYGGDLASKPAILALNKLDTTDEDSTLVHDTLHSFTHLRDAVKDLPEEIRPKNLIEFDHIIPISAKTGSGVDELKQIVRDSIDVHARAVSRSSDLTLVDGDEGGMEERSFVV